MSTASQPQQNQQPTASPRPWIVSRKSGPGVGGRVECVVDDGRGGRTTLHLSPDEIRTQYPR